MQFQLKKTKEVVEVIPISHNDHMAMKDIVSGIVYEVKDLEPISVSAKGQKVDVQAIAINVSPTISGQILSKQKS